MCVNNHNNHHNHTTVLLGKTKKPFFLFKNTPPPQKPDFQKWLYPYPLQWGAHRYILLILGIIMFLLHCDSLLIWFHIYILFPVLHSHPFSILPILLVPANHLNLLSMEDSTHGFELLLDFLPLTISSSSPDILPDICHLRSISIPTIYSVHMSLKNSTFASGKHWVTS